MSNLVCSLLGHEISVESSGLKVHGRLIGVSEAARGRPHKPMVLALQNEDGQTLLVRDWSLISFERALE
jgi:hypothetical protein